MEVDVLGHALMRTSNGFRYGPYHMVSMTYYIGHESCRMTQLIFRVVTYFIDKNFHIFRPYISSV